MDLLESKEHSPGDSGGGLTGKQTALTCIWWKWIYWKAKPLTWIWWRWIDWKAKNTHLDIVEVDLPESKEHSPEYNGGGFTRKQRTLTWI